MKFDPIAFRDGFLRAYEGSRFNSIRQLSLESGFSESHLHKIANGSFDHSNSGPGCFGIARVAYTLKTTPDALLGFDEAPAPRLADGPTIAKMFKCYFASGARIEGFSDMINFCDIYTEPKDGYTYLEKLGPLSLLSRETKVKDPQILQREFEVSEPELRQEIFEGQRKAWDAGAIAEPYYMDRRMVSRARHVRLPFVRAACRVSTLAGQERLLVFCQGIDK